MLQFMISLVARIAPVGYGAGSVLGTVTVLKALGDLWVTENSEPVLTSPDTLVGCGLVAAAAAFPLVCYWVFLVGNLINCLQELHSPVVFVTNETGWGIVPETPLGREYRDASGIMNQRVAAIAETVDLVVCGVAVNIKSTGSSQEW